MIYTYKKTQGGTIGIKTDEKGVETIVKIATLAPRLNAFNAQKVILQKNIDDTSNDITKFTNAVIDETI
jgi:hypothetical protein